jgi:3-hydroxyisobutyrate dehydrogenase-like beta-hydroxyacid dehydrogenase
LAEGRFFSTKKEERMFPNKANTSRSRLGFIGLGYMGSRIARRLIDAGFPMVVYDRDQTKTAELAALGAEVAYHPGRLASDVDIVLSCLADDAAVQDVYLGANKVLRSARPGAWIIELSTVAPETARRLNQAARKFEVFVLDVAVSGSTPAAETGKLTLFGGGDREVFEALQPVFAAIASQWFYMGPAGSGVAMKLVVNTLLGLGMQAIAEATALGCGLGLPRGLLLDVLATTAVVAPAHVGKLSAAKRNDYAPQFPVRLMRKDFGLILAAAAQFDVSMPATETAATVNSAEAATNREEDFSAVIRRMEQQCEVEKALPSAA